MKNFVLALVAIFFLAASGFAQDGEKEIKRLESELAGIERLEKDLGKFWPIIQDLKESDEDYLIRAGRLLKGRALWIHLLHQCMEPALEAKFRLEEMEGEKVKKALQDQRVAGLEEKAERLSEMAKVSLEGLELVGAKGLTYRIGLSRHEEKSFRAYQKYKFALKK